MLKAEKMVVYVLPMNQTEVCQCRVGASSVNMRLGCYLPSTDGPPALALLQLSTPPGRATDAYYQKLMGMAIRALMFQHMPVQIFSDCLSAIKRFRLASNPLGFSIGQL